MEKREGGKQRREGKRRKEGLGGSSAVKRCMKTHIGPTTLA